MAVVLTSRVAVAVAVKVAPELIKKEFQLVLILFTWVIVLKKSQAKEHCWCFHTYHAMQALGVANVYRLTDQQMDRPTNIGSAKPFLQAWKIFIFETSQDCETAL